MSRDDQALLSGAALATFKLNGQLLELAERLALPSGLTAAWWQVLGAVLREPLSVAGIAREMGVTRQGVQRIADLLVERRLATRAKLLSPTTAGRAAIAKIGPGHATAAKGLVRILGRAKLVEAVAALRALSAALDELPAE